MRDHRHTSGHVRALAIAATLALPVAGAASIALSSVASATPTQVIGPALTGTSFQGHEGVSHDFDVAGWVGADGVALQDVSVEWGDGSSASTGTLTGTHVHATHTYDEAGSYTVTVTGTAAPTGDVVQPSVPLSAGSTADISEAVVNLHHEKAQVLASNVGGAFDGLVAHGTDHNSVGDLSDFSAVIDWGDGSAAQTCTTCVVSTGGGDFNVSASHQFASAGLYVVSTMVSDGGNDVREVPVKSKIVVPVVAGVVTGVEGGPFSGTVGSVLTSKHADVAVNDATGDVTPAIALPSISTVAIDWGDGSEPSQGEVSSTGLVSGSHTYADEGSFTITLTGTNAVAVTPLVSGSKLTSWSSTNTVSIADAPLNGTVGSGNPFTATAGTSFSALLAHVVDTASNGKASDLSATIAWGDGTTSAVTLAASGGGYDASGSHTYSASGAKSGTVHFVDVGGSKADVPFTVNVATAQVQGITSNPAGNGPTGSSPHSPGTTGVIATPNTGGDLPLATAALLIVSGGSLFAVGRRRRS